MAEPLFVSCLGLVCAVGYTAPSAAAALRAGISGVVELPYADRVGQRISGAVVPYLPEHLRGESRQVELLSRAFSFLEQGPPAGMDSADFPLILCVREAGPMSYDGETLVQKVENQVGYRFQRAGSVLIARGQVAVFEALLHAQHLLASGEAKACFLAAVDTLIEARALCYLEQTKRLKTSVQTDGLIPGEAGCVAIVTRDPKTPSHVMLRGLGFATEPATVSNEEPMLGHGMISAVRNALQDAGMAMHNVDFRLSDVAGESYAFEELAIAQARLTRQPRETQELWHPADCIGDCGAAMGLVQLGWVEQAFARHYAPGPVALLHASAPAGARAAAIVTEQ